MVFKQVVPVGLPDIECRSPPNIELVRAQDAEVKPT